MNGNDTFLDVNNSHLRVTSGNVHASGFNLDQISIVTTSNTGSTINFLNDTKGFTSRSNIEVGTANLFVDTTTSNVGVGTNEPAYTLDVHGSANVGAITSTAINMSGHILPTLNATYDIGSAAFKIRDMYVDDNSLWIGDEAKISFTGNQLKFRRRKKTIVPSGLTTIGAAHSKSAATVESEALALSVGVNAVADMKLHHWVAYAKHLDPTKTAGDIYTDSAADYEASAASEAFKEVGDDIYSAHNISIGKTTAPTSALDVNGSIRGGYDQDETSYLGRAAIGYNGATTDAATFSHVDQNNGTDFALKQWSYGATDINAKSGMALTFRQGGVELGKFKGNGDFHVDGTSDWPTFFVDASMNRVGIGTKTPQYRLDVGSGGGDVMLRVMNGLATTGKLLFGRTGTADNRSHAIEVRNNGDGDNNYMKFLVHDGGGVSPFEGRTEVMILRGDGRVGIGTSIPDRLFHVNGTSRFVGEVEWLETGQSTSHANYGANRDWYIRSGTADGKVVIQDIHATSNVGIGTSTPGFKLDVTGDINYTGVIRRNGTIQALSSPFSTNGTKAYYTDGPVGIANVSALTTQTLQIGANVVVDDTASDKLVVSGDVFIARSLHAVDLVKTYEVKCNALFIKDVQVTNQVPEDGDLRGYTPGIS